jgi:hypothetical protein
MKRLISVVLLSLVFIISVFAQRNIEVSNADYEHLVESRLELNLRNYMINNLELTKAEVISFDPVFRKYMREKANLSNKKHMLLDDYTSEMLEDDRVSDEKEETADMIEDYWEFVIDEMELRKDYFDRFEDVLPLKKATDFFLLEEAFDNRLTYLNLVKLYPIIVEIEENSAEAVEPIKMPKKDKVNKTTAKKTKQPKVSNISYKKEVEAYNNWMNDTDEKVALDHNYTHDGLTMLMHATMAVIKAENIFVPNLKAQKAAIIKLADELRQDPLSDKHADKAKKAFTKTADLFKVIQNQKPYFGSKQAIDELGVAANKIDPTKLMIPQAEQVYNFFQKAGEALNEMANDIDWVYAPSTKENSWK